VLEPRSVDVYLLLGTVLRLNGNNEMAEKALLKAKALSPKPNPEIHWQLSLVYNRMKRNEDAAVQLETYLQILPDAPNRQQVMDTIAKLRAHK
jgi:Flp pilus assembly protein TadD